MATSIRILASFLTVTCLLAGSALAETMLEMTLEERVKASDLVIQGRVLDASSRWGDEQHTEVYTDYVIEVEDVLHGGLASKTVVVTQQGGTFEGVTLRVGSNPELVSGDRLVLMLAKADFLRGMARGDDRPKYTIVGVAQGTYYVVKGERADIALRDYARLAIVPRPDLVPAERSLADAVRAEVEMLRQAYKKNPEDQGLARRLAQAEALLSGALEAPKRKSAAEERPPAERETEPDLGAKPPAPLVAPQEKVEELEDAPSGAAERERAMKKTVEEHTARFTKIVAPIPLEELKANIRSISRQLK